MRFWILFGAILVVTEAALDGPRFPYVGQDPGNAAIESVSISGMEQSGKR